MKQTESQLRAWEVLQDRERNALSLVLGHERSMKEASNIMGISVYKFIETYLRARRFYLLFSDYFEFIAKNGVSERALSLTDIEFIQNLILSRKRITDFIYEVPQYKDLIITEHRKAFWQRVLYSLQIEQTEFNQKFLDLIKTYDTWNQFRILPKEFQEMSPYPRRRLRIFKQIKGYLEAISEVNWLIFEREFTKGRHYAYIPRIEVSQEPSSLRVALTKKTFKYFTDNHIPLFKTEKEAIFIADLIYQFNLLSHKNSYLARKFWSQFRLKLYQALNFSELLGGKDPELGDLPVKDRLFLKKVKSQVTKPKKPRIRLSKSSIFWELH